MSQPTTTFTHAPITTAYRPLDLSGQTTGQLCGLYLQHRQELIQLKTDFHKSCWCCGCLQSYQSAKENLTGWIKQLHDELYPLYQAQDRRKAGRAA